MSCTVANSLVREKTIIRLYLNLKVTIFKNINLIKLLLPSRCKFMTGLCVAVHPFNLKQTFQLHDFNA